MADFDFNDLKKTYESFTYPIMRVYIGGQMIEQEKTNLLASRVEVELSSGFEASIAEITLRGAFNQSIGVFKTDKAKNFILLGSTVSILFGYGASLREVFRGFIARVHFSAGDRIPAIILTAMDVKGSLMANRHSKRLKARYYSDAVKELLANNSFYTAKDDKGADFITGTIDNTPDKPESEGQGAGGQGQQQTDDVRVEMVEESDYEFIVKAAKKFNFEFYCVGENLYFIEARKNTTPLIELSLGMGLNSIDVGYDITGLVRQIEVRNVDSDQGSFLEKKKKLNSNISMGNRAKPMVENQAYVYIDPTAQNKEEVEYRLNYLSDLMDYRLGSITAVSTGLPELVPGRFISIVGMGKPVDNDFYLTRVRHVFTLSDFYTEFEGQANKIVK